MKTIFWLILLVTVALPASASFQFAGEDADPASNLIYLRGRHYDPQTGTFTGKELRRTGQSSWHPIELMQTQQIQGATWHFFQSPVTGLGEPSQPLLNALQQNGINFIIH